MIEKLESRRLMSAGISTSFTNGHLTVEGGNKTDTINVVESNHNVWVNSLNIDLTDPSTADFQGVNKIDISSSAKADQIFFTDDTVGANISGGGGKDSITIDDRGTGSSSAQGGGGGDSFIVLHSHNTTVVGGGGGDQFFLNTASDNTSANVVYAYGAGGGKDFFSVNSGGGTAIIFADKHDTVEFF